MASVIRVNTINSRSGLSTVTFDNSGAGIEVAGIATATSFSGAVSGTTGTFSGALSIAEKIIHTGDTNTSMKFDTDTVIFETAGDTRLRITSTGQVNIGGDYAQTDSRVTIIDATKLIQEATLNLQSSATSGAADTGAVLRFYGHSGTEGRYHSSIKGAKENGTSGNYAGYLSFNTRPNGSAMVERLRIKSDGKVLVGSGCTDASTFNVKGSAGFADDGTNAGLIISTDDANGAALSCLTAGGFVGGSYGVMRFNALQHKFTYGNTVRLFIDASGRIQRGSDPSNLGQALVNIVTGGENGISLGKNQGGAVSNGDVLGTLAFQCAVGSQTTNSAEASIKAIAEENSTGSTAATGLYFYTKQSGTGPGSSPAEALHINAQGMMCHTSTPTAKVYTFAYPLGTAGSTTTTTIATITNPTSSCLAVATIAYSASYGASGSTRTSGQFVCGVRRSQSGSAWSASTTEIGPAGDGQSYAIDCVWNGQTLQVTRGAWLNFVIDVRICIYNGTITNNLI